MNKRPFSVPSGLFMTDDSDSDLNLYERALMIGLLYLESYFRDYKYENDIGAIGIKDEWLSTLVGMSVPSLGKYRITLQQKGYIFFRPGYSGRATTYYINREIS